MFRSILRFSLFFIFLFSLSPSIHAESGTLLADSLNCSMSGGWLKGPTMAVCVYDSFCYAGYGRMLRILTAYGLNEVGSYLLPDTIRGIRAEGDYLFLSVDGAGFFVFDITARTAPVPVTHISRKGALLDLDTEDSLACAIEYYGYSSSALTLFDISNPFSPSFLCSIPFTSRVDGVHLVDTMLYAIAPDTGLYIANIKNPSSPSFVSATDLPRGGDDVFVVDTVAYISTYGYYTSWLTLMGISDPFAPSSLSTITDGGEAVWVDKRESDSTYAFVVNGDGFYSVDVTDPRNPRFLDSHWIWKDDYSPDLYYWDVNRRCYIANYEGGVYVVSVYYPDVVFHVSDYYPDGYACWIWVKDTLVYLHDGARGGLRIFNFKNPLSPILLGNYDKNMTSAVAIRDTIAFIMNYVWDGWNTYQAKLHLVNIKNPESPTFIDSMDFWKEELASYDIIGEDIELQDTLAFILIEYKDTTANTYKARIDVFNIRDLSNIHRVGYYEKITLSNSMTLRGSLVVLCDTSGFSLLNVSDPSQISSIVDVEYASNYLRAPIGAWIRDTLLYIAARYDGLQIYNISDYTNPVQVSGLSTPGEAWDVVVKGNYAYVSDGYYGVRIVDVSDPAVPVEVAYYDGGGFNEYTCIHDTTLYTTAGGYGFYTIKSDTVRAGMRIIQPDHHPVYAGKRDTITWIPSGTYGGEVLLEYSLDGGIHWMVLDTVSNTGMYVWRIPIKITSWCMVRVRDLSHLYAEDESEEFPVRAITLLSPNGGESYGAGDTCTITWICGDTSVLYTSIEYSLNAGTTWTTLVDSVQGNSYEWIIPPDVSTSSGLVKVSLYMADTILGKDVSDGTFSIVLQGVERKKRVRIEALGGTVKIWGRGVDAVIYNVTGRRVLEKRINGECNVPVPPGVYFVHIKMENEVLETHKVVVVR